MLYQVFNLLSFKQVVCLHLQNSVVVSPSPMLMKEVLLVLCHPECDGMSQYNLTGEC